MWKCNNCAHLELGTQKPDKCPVCGADAEHLLEHQLEGINGEQTPQNLKDGFIAESQASVRNLAFGMKADQEGLLQMGHLFRAVAQAEAVHAFNHLRLLGGVADTQTNLESAFERENLAGDTYPELIRMANDEGNPSVARVFGFVRDVEREHARLYRKALDDMMADRETDYYVCGVCGHVSDGELPEQCPVCGAPQDRFSKVL